MQSNLGTVAKNVGETADVCILPLAYGGHSYYVRKCKSPDEVEGIVLPDSVVERNNWAEVLGSGPKVGRPCSIEHRKRFRRVGKGATRDASYLARCINDVAEVGDMLLLPDTDERIKRSCLCDWEFYVEESLPLLIWKK